MAQTRKRRQTKHRGNAAGVVEARGRTGRRPTKEEKRGGAAPAQKRVDRRDVPPTWGGAFLKAAAAAAIMLVLLLVLGWGKSGQAVVLVPLALVLYTPVSYYTELWAFRRRQRAKAASR